MYFYRKDVQGNIIAIVDSNGWLVVEYSYDAWGRNTCFDESTVNLGTLNPFRYRGYYYDTETKLYYLKTRYYDPEIGRFISMDGIEYLDPDTINGLNLYAYCNNNPVMNVDPNGTFGLLAFCMCVVIGALVVGVGAATYTGVTAYNNGVRGWDLVGKTAIGFAQGAFIGALIGATIGGMIYVAPEVASFLGSSFTFGGAALAGGGSAAITLTGAQIAAAGLATLATIGIMYSSYNRKPAGPRNHSGSRKKAYDKAFYKGGKQKPIFHPHGKFGPHFHPAGVKFKHWHYYFALLFGFTFSED